MFKFGKNSLKYVNLSLVSLVFLVLFMNFAIADIITVPGNYSTIQGAVDNANPGDVIEVDPDTYYEDVTISKTNLTLKSTSTNQDTIINGSITVEDDDVTIGGSGFGITGGECGIYAASIDGLNVLENDIFENGDGICLDFVGGSTQSKIIGNHIHDNEFTGVSIDGSYNINLSNNTINNNSDAGADIYGEGSWDIFFHNNEIYGSNGEGSAGIYSDDSTVYVNNDNIHDNFFGIYSEYGGDSLNVFGADIHDNEFGIYIYNDDLEAMESNIHDNQVGVYVSSGEGGFSEADLNNNNIVNNTDAGVETGGDGNEVDATFNYWGSVDGPSGIGPGTGDAIIKGSEDDEVEFSPWLGLPFGTAPMTFGVNTNSSLEDAIDAASDGDTILVGDGVYTGDIVVDKSITFQGTGFSSTTTIDCSGAGTGIEINANNSVVADFKIINCDIGVEVNSLRNIIKNNSFNGNDVGVKLTQAEDNEVSFNVIEGNSDFGIENEDNTEDINGTFNYWGSCDGPSGPAGTGNGDNVSADVNFVPWIGVCITNKTNATCSFESQNITLSANISSQVDLNKVLITYTINGNNFNKSAIKTGGDIYSAVLNTSELVGGTFVSWNVLVNDTFGNNFTNGLKTFYVRNDTNLTVNPDSPDGLNGWYVSEPVFTLTADGAGGNVYYQWDSFGLPILYSGPFNLDTIPNAPPKQSAGILELNYFTDFGVCGNESEQTELFFVDLTNPEINSFVPANDSTVYNNLKPNISAFLDEVYQSNSGIDETTIIMKLNGSVVPESIAPADGLDAIVWFKPVTDLDVGINNVTVIITDNAGRSTELTWFFEIAITPAFSMVVNSPVSGIFGSRRTPFNITLGAKVELLEYINHDDRRPRFRRLCSNCGEYGNSSKRTKNVKEGDNSI